MKKLSLFMLLFLFSCSSEDRSDAAENDMDAARNFLDAALDGKWHQAKSMMLQDSTNVQLLELAESRYQLQKNEEKINLMEAHPIIHESRMIGDSVTIVTYSNTHTQKKDSLKVVRVGNEWLVDLKYSLLPANNQNDQ